jgi:hypothetical protein
MAHISELELIERLDEAKQKVEVGARYRHSKTLGKYVVLDIVLREETEQPAVIYQAEYGDKLTWDRTVDMFTSMDEIDGQMVPKFVKID